MYLPCFLVVCYWLQCRLLGIAKVLSGIGTFIRGSKRVIVVYVWRIQAHYTCYFSFTVSQFSGIRIAFKHPGQSPDRSLTAVRDDVKPTTASRSCF